MGGMGVGREGERERGGCGAGGASRSALHSADRSPGACVRACA